MEKVENKFKKMENFMKSQMKFKERE